MKLAAIYSRVSTDEQSKGYSLQTQIDACHTYALERGYTVVEVFTDDYTGAAIDRPALNNLRDYMARNPLDVVIVYDIDRLARKSAYQVLIEEEFNRAGVAIEFVMAQYEDNDEGRLQKQIRGVIAEYEKAKIMERSKRGKRGKAKSGFVVAGSRPPYGYRVLSEPHKAWFEIDEDEAAVVRMIFDWYINGDERGVRLSANGIAKKLTRMRVPTRGDREEHVAKKHGRGVWQRAMVIHVLTNETYTGTWYFGKTKMIDDGKKRKPRTKCGFGKQVPRSRDEWIPVDVPQIIDPDTFARATKRKEELHVQRGGHAVKEYLMKSRLTCSKCGYAMRGQFVRQKHQYYLCNGRRQVVSLCDMPSIRGDWVDAVVWEWAKMIIESPENLRVGLDDVQKELEQENQSLFNRLGILEEQMSQYQSQLDKLLDLYLDGNFPKEVLTERKSRLEELLFNLGKEKNDLMSHVRHVTMTDDQLNYIEAFCAKIRKGLDRVDFNTKRQIIELLDIRGKVAFENGQKVLYLKCLIDPIDSEEQQQRLPMQISPSLNTGEIVTTNSVFPSTDPFP
ncbi:MAG: recombinase family protein [Anaerolineales bacterium]|nr:recombinase family protein [Anaerolineales bacterium]